MEKLSIRYECSDSTSMNGSWEPTEKEYMTTLGIIGAESSHFKLAKSKGEVKVNGNKTIDIPKIFKQQKAPIDTTVREENVLETSEPLLPEELRTICKTEDKANGVHKKKMLEICEGYSEEDARIACTVFARKFPGVMYQALSTEHQNMCDLVAGVSNLNATYLRKMDGES